MACKPQNPPKAEPPFPLSYRLNPQLQPTVTAVLNTVIFHNFLHAHGDRFSEVLPSQQVACLACSACSTNIFEIVIVHIFDLNPAQHVGIHVHIARADFVCADLEVFADFETETCNGEICTKKAAGNNRPQSGGDLNEPPLSPTPQLCTTTSRRQNHKPSVYRRDLPLIRNVAAVAAAAPTAAHNIRLTQSRAVVARLTVVHF